MIFSAFILGLVGSLHCAGMCGPLALAIPVVQTHRASAITSRLLYNGGRITTYAIIGACFGVIGETISLAGFQRWLSLSAGALLLLGLAFAGMTINKPATRFVIQLKAIFAKLLRQRSYSALFALGVTNGFLPCGLVYVAAAAAASTGHIPAAAEYMVAFGLGTLPVMLAIPLLGRQLSFRFSFRKLVPMSVAVVALLLILRGLSLDIPYLSPDLTSTHCVSCH